MPATFISGLPGGFPCGSAGKESTCIDLGSIPGLGRSPGEGQGYPVEYSGLEISMDCIVHGVAKSRTRMSDFHFHTIIIVVVTIIYNVCGLYICMILFYLY